MTATTAREVTARKQHWCFLCSLPIEKGSVYLRWACIGDAVTTIKVHSACSAYAHDRIDDWTNGDGVEHGALASHLRDRMVVRQPGGWAVVAGVSVEAEAEILAAYPGLAAQVAVVRAEIEAEIEEEAKA